MDTFEDLIMTDDVEWLKWMMLLDADVAIVGLWLWLKQVTHT